jgi:hypothetical protein
MSGPVRTPDVLPRAEWIARCHQQRAAHLQAMIEQIARLAARLQPGVWTERDAQRLVYVQQVLVRATNEAQYDLFERRSA